MRAFSAAWGLLRKGAFMRPPILQKNYWLVLLDENRLPRWRLLLRQRQLEHAILELGLHLGLVDLLRQRESTAHLAVDALGMQHALVVGRLLLLHLGLQADLGAIHG